MRGKRRYVGEEEQEEVVEEIVEEVRLRVLGVVAMVVRCNKSTLDGRKDLGLSSGGYTEPEAVREDVQQHSR